MATTWKSPLKAIKAVNAALLQKLGVGSCPITEGVQAATFRMMTGLRPGDLSILAERFLKQSKISDFLYTLPYASDFQPIEQFWAYAKDYAAKTWKGETRNPGHTLKLLRHDFYSKLHADGGCRIEPLVCTKLVEKSMKYADQAVARDDILGFLIANPENAPAQYQVSEESGIRELGDNEIEVLDVDVE